MLSLQKNRLLLSAFFALFVLLPSSLYAGNAWSGFGIGGYVQGGNRYEDGGLWARIWTTPRKNNLDLQLSISKDMDSFGAYGGYYWQNFDLVKLDPSAGSIPLYHGPNLGVGGWSNGAAVRGGWVGGISYVFFEGVPISFSLQMNPNLEIIFDDIEGNDVWDLDLLLQLGFRVFIN